VKSVLLSVLALLLYLALGPVSASAQSPPDLTVRGHVTDRATGDPLPHANIRIAGTAYGTATNATGRFVLTVERLPVRLTVRYLGYTTRTIPVRTATDSLAIRLAPTAYAMDEVVVTQTRAERLVEAMVRRLQAAAEQPGTRAVHPGRAFYRQATVADDTVYTEFVETFYNAFTAPNGLRGWSIEQGRYARIDDGRFMVFTNFATVTGTFRLLQTDPPRPTMLLRPLRPDVLDYFDVSVVRRFPQDERTIVEIVYRPKPPVETAAARGRLFIDAETHVLHRFTATVEPHPTFSPVTPPQGTRIEEAHMTLTGTMRTMEHGTPVLDRLNVDLQYIHHKDDHFRRRMQTRSVFFFYDFDDVAGISATPVAVRQDDYARIDAAAYDPAFWRDHPVLARTPTDRTAIASFERTGAFGRLTDMLE